MKMRGVSGEVVDVITYTDKTQQTRRVYRLTRHGRFVGEYKTRQSWERSSISPNSSRMTRPPTDDISRQQCL
jgi:hypothetical protein